MEARIGEAAGRVWQVLHQKGPMMPKAIVKATGLSTELANQAIGWLAREGKLVQTEAKIGLKCGQ